MASQEDGARSEAGTPTPNNKTPGEAPGAAPAVAPAPETDQWVQCDRCRTWRVVPAQHWPSVEADTREVTSAPRTSARTAAAPDTGATLNAIEPSSSGGPERHGNLAPYENRLLALHG